MQALSLTLNRLQSSKRHRLAVLDANFYWTAQLFSAYSEFADVLLLRPVNFRTFKQRYGSYFVDLVPKQVDEHVWEQRICCPPGWLFHYWPLTQYLLNQVIQNFQGDSPLSFVFSYPYYAALAKQLNAYSIYYTADDYRDYWPGRQSKTIVMDGYAVSLANLTLCTAKHRLQHLQQRYPNYADRIVHIPHGCSTQFMTEEVLLTPHALPASLQCYRRPIAGYVGALGYRFDFSFLATVAEQLPEMTFLLGGKLPTEADGSAEWWQGVDRCNALTNIHFIGFVPHQQLGQYLQAFDVLLMLYSNCNFNINACPTKLWDYMGTSRPIVANSVVPEVMLWKDVIHIAETPQQYAGAIQSALVDPMWKAAERLKIAKANTWKDQARKLNALISPAMAEPRI